MKSQKTLALAASILSLTLSAFPHDAAASTGITPPPPLPACCKGTHIPGPSLMETVVGLAESVLTILVP